MMPAGAWACGGLGTAYFNERGLIRLVETHRRGHEHVVAPAKRQLVLAWE